MNDLKFALRQLRKAPGFTIAAVIVLACAIGARSHVFARGRDTGRWPRRRDRQLFLLAKAKRGSLADWFANDDQRSSFHDCRHRAERVHDRNDFFSGSVAATGCLRSGRKRFSRFREKDGIWRSRGAATDYRWSAEARRAPTDSCAFAQRFGREFEEGVSG